ncbi:MAG: MoaD/ThiS family protein [Dehalococcoidia bacterium]|nr:MoaD/ThiS family protein [Dehalococcoidia bacterium]
MKITVELQAYLEQYAPDGRGVFDCELPAGARVWDLVRKLGVPDELANVVVVGNTATDLEYELSEGDRVTLIPPIAGG